VVGGPREGPPLAGRVHEVRPDLPIQRAHDQANPVHAVMVEACSICPAPGGVDASKQGAA